MTPGTQHKLDKLHTAVCSVCAGDPASFYLCSGATLLKIPREENFSVAYCKSAWGTRHSDKTKPCRNYTRPGSNWRPSACEADVIATRPQMRWGKSPFCRDLGKSVALAVSFKLPRLIEAKARAHTHTHTQNHTHTRTPPSPTHTHRCGPSPPDDWGGAP